MHAAMQRGRVRRVVLLSLLGVVFLAGPHGVDGAPITPKEEAQDHEHQDGHRYIVPPKSTIFHVVKGKDDVHEVHLEGRTCQVSYRAANSAHGEKWTMEIKKEGEVYTCVIEDKDKSPPHASFYGWSAHLFGASSETLESYEVWTHEEVLLEEDGYIVEGITIRSDSHWNLMGLSKIVMKCK
jgi:hypothetical protein